MSIKRFLTDDEKKLMEQLYADGHTTHEIGEIVGRANQTVRNHLEAVGLLVVKHPESKQSKTLSKCPHCHKTGHLKGARFCYNCGADIRSEEIVLAERVSDCFNVISLLPEDAANRVGDTLRDVLSYLKKNQ